MAINVMLLITIIVMSVLIIFGALVLVYHFQSEEDRNTAYFPKFVVVLGLSLACFNVLLLPLDVGNRNSGNTIDMTSVVYVDYIAVMVMLFAVVPFALFYYESDDVTLDKSKRKSQTKQAIIMSVLTFVVLALLTVITYLFLSEADIPVTVLSSPLVPANMSMFVSCDECVTSETTFSVRVTFIVYTISMLAFLGLLVFVCLGGIGLVALPMDKINAWRKRPKRLTAKEYQQLKTDIGRRSGELIDEGKRIQEWDRENPGKKRNRKMKKAFKRFKKDVYAVESEYNRVKACYEGQRSPFWYWTDLIVGLFFLVISVMWLVHMIVFMAFDPYLGLFLNALFAGLDSFFPLFGTIAYCIFVFYLLWAVMKGTFKVGMRVAFFTLYPMEPHNTMMNAFLFNVALILLSSVFVSQFCTRAFSVYTRLTAVESIFNLQIGNLRFFTYFFSNVTYILIGVIVLSGIYLCAFPKDHNKRPTLEGSDS